MPAKDLIFDCEGNLGLVPDLLRKYDNRKHISAKTPILGSFVLTSHSDQISKVTINKLVIDGSSQWVVEGNLTKHCSTVNFVGNCYHIPVDDATSLNIIQLCDQGCLSYIPFGSVTVKLPDSNPNPMLLFFCVSTGHLWWKDTKRVIKKVRKHVCGILAMKISSYF